MTNKTFRSTEVSDQGLYGLVNPVVKPSTPQLTPMQLYFQQALAQINKMGGAGSAGSPVNYMGQAQQLLGGLDMSAFNELRQALLGSAETSQTALTNQFNNLIEGLLAQSKENKQQLGQARGTIMENAFSRNREAYRNLAARGLGASGLQQLAAVQNRMETGRQVSGVTGQYYDSEEKIAETKEQGTESYALQQQAIQDSLNSNLASLSANEIQFKNSYQQNLANLAMQLQANAQSQLNAAASVEQAKLQALLGLQGQQAEYEEGKTQGTESIKLQIAGSDDTIEVKIAQWMDKFGVSRDEAISGINSYKSKYESGKTNEYFNTLQTATDRINTKESMSSLLSNMRDTYLQGAINENQMVDFVAKNLDKLNRAETLGAVEWLNVTTTRSISGDKLAAAFLLMNEGIISKKQYEDFKTKFGVVRK